MYYLSSRQTLREREQNNINTNNLQNITDVTNNLPNRPENEINNNYAIRYNNNFMNVGGATWSDLCQHGCGYYHLTSATKGIT